LPGSGLNERPCASECAVPATEWNAATGEYVGVADDRWTGAAAGVRR